MFICDQSHIHSLNQSNSFIYSILYSVTDSFCLFCFSASFLLCSELCLCVSVLSIYFCLLSPSPSPSFSFLSFHSNTHGLSERCASLGALLDSCIGGRRLGRREERPSPYPPPWPYCPLSSAQSDRGEYHTEDGLVKGHAYSVTGTHKVSAPCQVGCQEVPWCYPHW